jgi:hypothetical protein
MHLFSKLNLAFIALIVQTFYSMCIFYVRINYLWVLTPNSALNLKRVSDMSVMRSTFRQNIIFF